MEKLKQLCSLNGTSGRENAVRNYIINEIKDYADIKVDALGNVIAFVKGENRAKRTVMADAHMDEVGIIVTYITEGGMLKFATVGGINTSVLLARRVVFENGTIGVISTKPVHMLSSEEKEKMPDKDALYIDIGARSFSEAAAKVSLGDTAVFDSEFDELGELIISKALDDRAGCWALIEIIKSKPKYDFYASFSVQEEVGAGAKTVAYSVAPDFAIVVEATTAADLLDVSDDKKVCKVGEGAVISFMDKGTLYDKELYDFALKIASDNNIKCQAKSFVAGGNNAAGIHQSKEGVRTVAISVPCRYIHSASNVASFNDVKSVRDLTSVMVEALASGELL